MLLLVFLFSFTVTFLGFPIIIPRLKRAGITGKNMNSEIKEEIPEMGGLIIVAGFSGGIILTIFIKIFYKLLPDIYLVTLLACLSTVLIVALIGIFDDLISMRQIIKAFMPIFAALPLMAIEIGDNINSIIIIPFLGSVNFGILYPLLLVPLGVTGATNAFNMLAGFNGLEVGLGIVCMVTVSIIAYITDSMTALAISLSCLGALIAAIYYNWYPAKVLVGDIGTLCIGSVLAVCVIVGNFETAGIILIIPFLFEFIIKAVHKYPSRGWWGVYREGKLYCPETGAVSLPQIIMKIVGGIKEKYLVLLIIGIEAVFGVIAILYYI